MLDDLDIAHIDGLLLDLGLSSDQIAWGHRGFSFAVDGPLDMRFDPKSRLNRRPTWSTRSTRTNWPTSSINIGEERHSRRVARKLVEARRVEPIRTTARLADLVRKSIPGKWGAIDPATRVFQALRIKVNGELDQLDSILPELGDLLRPGGRAAII